MDDPTRKNICIVGNSAKILGQGMGRVIDSFDNVCRLNDWVVRGYQKDVGSKLTHWVTGTGQQIPRWSKRRSFKNKQVIILWPEPLFNTWMKYGKQDLHTDGSLAGVAPILKLLTLQRLGYAPSEDVIWNDNDSEDLYDTKEGVHLVPHYITKRIAEKTKVAYPSTGLATIAYFKFILKYNVYTIGFDFFQESNDHYWDKNGNQCKVQFHDLKDELNTYNEWVDNGVITKLNPSMNSSVPANACKLKT